MVLLSCVYELGMVPVKESRGAGKYGVNGFSMFASKINSTLTRPGLEDHWRTLRTRVCLCVGVTFVMFAIEMDFVDFRRIICHFWLDLELHGTIFPRLFPKPETH